MYDSVSSVIEFLEEAMHLDPNIVRRELEGLDSPLRATDKRVGNLPDGLCRVLALSFQKSTAALIAAEAFRLGAEREAVRAREFFHFLLRMQFPEVVSRTAAVREGGIVVLVDGSSRAPIDFGEVTTPDVIM